MSQRQTTFQFIIRIKNMLTIFLNVKKIYSLYYIYQVQMVLFLFAGKTKITRASCVSTVHVITNHLHCC